MRRIISAATLAACLWSLAAAADQTPEKIRFPISTAPAPNPTAITTLTADRLYVIDSDIPVIVLASPEGLVSVTEESGPIKIRGKFIDGTGKTETRTYKGKSVYSIEALATGRVELLIVPAGSTKTADVIRKTVDVDAGTGPIPPPKPPDPKPPTPPDPPQPVTSFHVVFVYESGSTLTATQTGVLYSKDIALYLGLKCTQDAGTAGWRRRDKDAVIPNETAFQKSLWDAVKPKITAVPCMIVEVNGKADILPLPATVAEGLATLQKYAEGK